MAYTSTITTKQGEEKQVYIAVDEIINCKREKKATVILKAYISKDAANSGKLPVETCQIICENNQEVDGEIVNYYDNFISVEAVEADGNEFKQAYLFLNEIKPEVFGVNFDQLVSDEN